jgi:hypothetical protein
MRGIISTRNNRPFFGLARTRLAEYSGLPKRFPGFCHAWPVVDAAIDPAVVMLGNEHPSSQTLLGHFALCTLVLHDFSKKKSVAHLLHRRGPATAFYCMAAPHLAPSHAIPRHHPASPPIHLTCRERRGRGGMRLHLRVRPHPPRAISRKVMPMPPQLSIR